MSANDPPLNKTPLNDTTAGEAVVFQVRRNDEASRYEAFLGTDLIGFADFHATGSVPDSEIAIVLPHVEIDTRHEGRGYASQLTKATLDDLRARGLSQVVPHCPYVRAWIARHPEYQDLVPR